MTAIRRQLLLAVAAVIFGGVLFLWSVLLFATPLVGQPVTTVLPIRTDYKSYTVPLPAGNWTVAAAHEISGTDYYGDAKVLGVVDGVYVYLSLVQQKDGVVTGLIFLAAQVKSAVNTRSPDLCLDMDDALYANKYGASRIVNRCLEVKPLFTGSGRDFTELLNKTREWLDKVGLSLPTEMIGFQYAEFDRSNRYLDFSYYLNTNVYGINPIGTPNGQSGWSKGAVSRDSKKTAFQTALIAYAQKYSTALHDAVQGRGTPSALTLQPFVFNDAFTGVVGSKAPLSNESAGPEERLDELKRLCKSIGFKDGTKSMQDCVKELLVR